MYALEIRELCFGVLLKSIDPIQVRTMSGHSARVGTLAWKRHVLSSGSRDSSIIQHDVRMLNHKIATLAGHEQEVIRRDSAICFCTVQSVVFFEGVFWSVFFLSLKYCTMN